MFIFEFLYRKGLGPEFFIITEFDVITAKDGKAELIPTGRYLQYPVPGNDLTGYGVFSGCCVEGHCQGNEKGKGEYPDVFHGFFLCLSFLF